MNYQLNDNFIIFDSYQTYDIDINSLIFNGFLSFYMTLYLFLYFKPIFKNEFTFKFKNNDKLSSVHLLTYGMSTIHSIIISISCILYFVKILNIPQMFNVYYFSIAYFTGDLAILFLNMIFTNQILKEDLIFIIHHFITSILELYVITSKNNINDLVYYLNMALIAEFPVIFLNIIWFMKNNVINYYQKPFFKICFVSLWVNYLIFRFINLNYLSYTAFQNNMIIEFLIGFPILIMNNYWFYKLTKIFISVLTVSKKIYIDTKTK
jgi:hypothetical protein